MGGVPRPSQGTKYLNPIFLRPICHPHKLSPCCWPTKLPSSTWLLQLNKRHMQHSFVFSMEHTTTNSWSSRNLAQFCWSRRHFVKQGHSFILAIIKFFVIKSKHLKGIFVSIACHDTHCWVWTGLHVHGNVFLRPEMIRLWSLSWVLTWCPFIISQTCLLPCMRHTYPTWMQMLVLSFVK